MSWARLSCFRCIASRDEYGWPMTAARLLDLLLSWGWSCYLDPRGRLLLQPPLELEPATTSDERRRRRDARAQFLDAVGPQLRSVGRVALVTELQRQDALSRQRLTILRAASETSRADRGEAEHIVERRV